MPAMRPFKTISNTEARPIKQPPSKAEVGSNDATTNLPPLVGPLVNLSGAIFHRHRTNE